MPQVIFAPADWKIAQATVNLAQAANTYDLLTCSGGAVLIDAFSLFCTVVGATFTACTIQTDDTVNFVFVDATAGARANFVANSNMAITWAQVQKCYLRSGQKIRYTITGSTGTGTALATVRYMQLSPASVLA